MENYSDSELLTRLYVAAPCPVSWDDMEGDEKTRHCQQYQLNVYNIQELSKKEVVTLVKESEGRVCGRLYRRMDGKVITNNCPKGLQFIRRMYKIVASVVVAALVCLGFVDSAQAQGLIGAPVDPRYGASGMLSFYESPLPGNLIGHPLVYSYAISVLLFLWGFTIRHRSKLALTAISIGITMFAAGFMFH